MSDFVRWFYLNVLNELVLSSVLPPNTKVVLIHWQIQNFGLRWWSVKGKNGSPEFEKVSKLKKISAF